MKRLLVILFVLGVNQSIAQKNIEGLVNAEKSFAAYSVAHGTKDAFLKFLDSNGIVFEQGEPVNGIQSWKKKENRSSVLNWGPLYAEISLSNDFGYTTGPWELRPNSNTDSVVARGQFVTVWHLDSNGDWKFLVDLGVGNSPKAETSNLTKVKAKKIYGEQSITEMLKSEQNFISAYTKDKSNAYSVYLSKQSLLNRNGLQYPAVNKKAQSKLITNTPSNLRFSILGSGIASSGDLAYVYGNTIIDKKQDNYLHIWRKEKTGWKLAMEVLRY